MTTNRSEASTITISVCTDARTAQNALDHWIGRQTLPDASQETLAQTVRTILRDVRQEGDVAVARWATHWGDPTPRLLTPHECNQRIAELNPGDKHVIETAAANISAFARAVLQLLSQPVEWHQMDAHMGMRFAPVASVGCYVPGGRYPLPSSALMTAVTAQVAGVKHRVLASPNLQPATVYAGLLAGVETFIEVGGAQALAAMAYGTETIEAVDMIVGPGNAAVVEAKRQLLGTIGIDALAGPSEVVTIADATAPPDWVAVDLLAQTEHAPDTRACILTDSLALAEEVGKLIPDWHQRLRLPAFMKTSLSNSGVYVLPDLAACVTAANRLAPEHLQLMVADPSALQPQLTAYGALFLGMHTSVPYGDYAAGPNHTLPTGRAARFSGALSPLAFLRPQTWLTVNPSASDLSITCERFARLEGLEAHAASVRLRMTAAVDNI